MFVNLDGHRSVLIHYELCGPLIGVKKMSWFNGLLASSVFRKALKIIFSSRKFF
ncbi:MAG: hypothetical protein ACTSYS_12165 [Promethearchaeota archaeon]